MFFTFLWLSLFTNTRNRNAQIRWSRQKRKIDSPSVPYHSSVTVVPRGEVSPINWGKPIGHKSIKKLTYKREREREVQGRDGRFTVVNQYKSNEKIDKKKNVSNHFKNMNKKFKISCRWNYCDKRSMTKMGWDRQIEWYQESFPK